MGRGTRAITLRQVIFAVKEKVRMNAENQLRETRHVFRKRKSARKILEKLLIRERKNLTRALAREILGRDGR